MRSEPRHTKQNNILKVTIILGKSTIHRDLPVCWEDVTFAQFLDLESCGQDIIKVIALLTGVDYLTLCAAKIVDMDNVISLLKFLNTQPVTAIPKTILGYTVPEKLDFEQVQQYIDLKNYVAESAKMTPTEQLRNYTLYCAVYACIAKHGKYEWQLAEGMRDEFLQAPCTEVMGIGNFTLLRLIGLKHNIDLNSPKVSSLIKKFKLVLAGWRIRMVLFLRSFNWKKKLA